MNNYKYILYLKRILLIFICVFFSYIDVYSIIWTQRNSPNGGYVGQIVKLGGNLYSNTINSGLYVSNLSGLEWNKIQNKDLNSEQFVCINSDDSYIYIATFNKGVFRYNPQNNTFKQIHNGKTKFGEAFFVNKIYIEDSQIYLCSSKGLFQSSNQGDDWSEIPTNSNNNNIIDFVKYESDLYIISSQGLSVSKNNGNDWSSLGIGKTNIYKLFKFNDLLYFCTHDSTGQSGFYFNIFEKSKSSDSIKIYNEDIFKNYQVFELSSKYHKLAFSLLRIQNKNANVKLAYSLNSGNDWEISFDSTFNNTVFISNGLLIESDNIFVGTQTNGILKHNFLIEENSIIANNFQNLSIPSLITENNLFIAGTEKNGFFISEDYGKNWKSSSKSPQTELDNYLNIFRIIKKDNIYFSATSGGIFSSTDNGKTWNSIYPDVTITDLKTDGKNIYAVGNIISGQFMSSGDNGKTWSTQKIPNSAIALGLLKYDNNVFINTNLGIYRSLDNGMNWQNVLQLNPSSLYLSPMIKDDSNIIIASLEDIFISKDNGTNWIKIQNPPKSIIINDFKKLDKLLFMSTMNGIYLSLDNGMNWNEANDGIESREVSSISISGDTIFASIAYNTIYSAVANDFSKIRISNISSDIFCSNMSFNIEYEADKSINFTSNNKFIAELSDANGSFNNDTREIGFVQSQTNGTITAQIPANINFGTGYRIRIVSTEPKIIGIDNMKGLTILEKTIPKIQGEINVCSGKEYIYSVGENPGFDFNWIISGGNIVDYKSNNKVVVKWDANSKGSLKVIQKSIAWCTDSSEINTIINISPEKPIITKLSSDTLISSNLYGNQWYFNDLILQDDTNRILVAKIDGIYRVKTINEFGCESEFSDSYSFIKDENSIIFSIDTISANSGDEVFLNIRLIKNKKYYESNISKFTVTLVFNSSLLYPLVENKGVVIDNKRYLEIEFDTNYISSNIIKVVPFRAMLGDAVNTNITISSLKINNINENAFKSRDGLFYLTDICFEGGPRLISSSQTPQINYISPNPANEKIDVEISIPNDTKIKMYILNTIGEKIQIFPEEFLRKGIYKYKFDVRNLPISYHYLLLESELNQSIGKFIISR